MKIRTAIARSVKRLATLTLVVATLLVGCAKMAPSVMNDPVSAMETGQGRAVIRSGSLSLRVADLDDTRARIETLSRELGARIDNWSTYNDKHFFMTLRVPESKLDQAMDRIAALGRVVGRSLRVQDVTEQLIDLKIRLKNLYALRERLRSYLDQAANLEEILGVERELARVQSEIESFEAKLKILEDQVAMSELDIRVRRKGWF